MERRAARAHNRHSLAVACRTARSISSAARSSVAASDFPSPLSVSATSRILRSRACCSNRSPWRLPSPESAAHLSRRSQSWPAQPASIPPQCGSSSEPSPARPPPVPQRHGTAKHQHGKCRQPRRSPAGKSVLLAGMAQKMDRGRVQPSATSSRNDSSERRIDTAQHRKRLARLTFFLTREKGILYFVSSAN